jgi:hypothetical protein
MLLRHPADLVIDNPDSIGFTALNKTKLVLHDSAQNPD